MAKRQITVFYAWQSDRDTNGNQHFIRKALDDAADRMNEDSALGVELKIDADTEGVVGTPPVTETILNKIRTSDIFVPDLTFVAETVGGKLVPNPNVMVEYGYALRSLTFEAMMPVMNTYYGEPEKLPFDLGHVRHPTQYGFCRKTFHRVCNQYGRRRSGLKMSRQIEFADHGRFQRQSLPERRDFIRGIFLREIGGLGVKCSPRRVLCGRRSLS